MVKRLWNESGQVVLEMLLVLLVLLPLLFGGIELGRGIALRHALDSGVGVAVRALSLDPTQWDWALAVVRQAVRDNVLGKSGVGETALRACDASGAPLSPEALAELPFGSAFRLEAEAPFAPDLPLVGGRAIQVRVSHWGVVERYP